MKRTIIRHVLHPAFLVLWMAAAGAQPPATVRFAVIGDYGKNTQNQANVAAMVTHWEPDFIITLGDNSYVNQDPFDKNGVMKPYAAYIRTAADQPKDQDIRFFPSLGNLDYSNPGSGNIGQRIRAYEQAFAVPAGEGGHHYYQFARGPVRLFALDSNDNSAWSGARLGSRQHEWWKSALASATEPWKIVFFHHAAYNSGKEHGSNLRMQQ